MGTTGELRLRAKKNKKKERKKLSGFFTFRWAGGQPQVFLHFFSPDSFLCYDLTSSFSFLLSFPFLSFFSCGVV